MKRNYVVLSICLGVGILVLVFLILSRSWGSNLPTSHQIVDAITLTDGNTQFTLDGSGQATWKTGDVSRSELWSSEKTASLFAYFYANWSGSANIVGGAATVSNPSDELGKVILNDNGGGSGGGDDISHFFSSAPSPTPSGGGSGSSGDTSGGSGDNGAPSWCQHWRLSYCADPPPSTSGPTSTPVPSGPTPLPPDCNNAGNQETGRTVIGNELCLSPSPSATP